jgi:hypothetical protein
MNVLKFVVVTVVKNAEIFRPRATGTVEWFISSLSTKKINQTTFFNGS